MIRVNGFHFLIDLGPDFRMQMLSNGFLKIDAVLITHEHADHTAGLDDIRPIYFLQKKPIPLYSSSEVLEDLKKRFDYIFGPNDYPGIPRFELNTLTANHPVNIHGIEILPIAVSHGSLPVLGFKIGKLVYITDARSISDELIDLIQGAELLVLNALHHKEHHSHLNLQQALQYIDRIKPAKAYLIHMSHHMGTHNDITPKLPDNVFLAYDGLVVSVI